MELGLALGVPFETLLRVDERALLTYVDILDVRNRG
jgi:hypothetical protein